MSEGVWLAAYAVLAVGTVSALAVPLMTARQLGRLISHSDADGAEDVKGFAPDSAFPDLAIYGADGSEVRPATWAACLLVQVAVTRESDLAMLRELRELVGNEFRHYTVVSVTAPASPLSALAAALAPIHVVDDRAGIVEAAVGTRYRPHAVLMADGRVMRAQTFESVEDIHTFIAQANADPEITKLVGLAAIHE